MELMDSDGLFMAPAGEEGSDMVLAGELVEGMRILAIIFQAARVLQELSTSNGTDRNHDKNSISKIAYMKNCIIGNTDLFLYCLPFPSRHLIAVINLTRHIISSRFFMFLDFNSTSCFNPTSRLVALELYSATIASAFHSS